MTLADIRAAAERIRGFVLRTPLLPLAEGAWIKVESLQPTGSFKVRGAYNALAGLSPERRAAGVVTHSSGNHAQAIARSARLLGIRAVVVMPDNAPAIKVAGVRADGAEIVFVGPANEERVERAHQIADDDGLELVLVGQRREGDRRPGDGRARNLRTTARAGGRRTGDCARAGWPGRPVGRNCHLP